MHHVDFEQLFAGHVEKLDMFFHNKCRDAGMWHNIEDYKKDLLQETAYGILVKLNKEKYNDYDFSALVWIKAEDAWHRHMKDHLRASRAVHTIEENFEAIDATAHYVAVVDHSNLLQELEVAAGEKTWQMLLLHAKGYTYKHIADRMGINEGIVKMRIMRFRNRVIRGPKKQ